MTKLSQNPRYLIYRDLIGLNVHIKPKNSKKLDQEFIPAGIVINETYNTIITSLESDPKKILDHTKQYIKTNTIFRFELPTEDEILIIEVDGNKILKLPENRIKLLKKMSRRQY